MNKHSNISKKYLLLAVAAIALAACGGSSTSNTDANRVKNAVRSPGPDLTETPTTPTAVAPTTTSSVAPTTTTSVAAALTCATGGLCAVGDTGPGGGKVFYATPGTTSFNSAGSACNFDCKYLEAAPTGWIAASAPAGQTNCAVPGTGTSDPGCYWSGNASSLIGTTKTEFGFGYSNTSSIIAQSGTAGTAATVARAFRGGGKTDWFLPSKDELNLMYAQRTTIGGLAAGAYWSSSENDAVLAWGQSLNGTFQHNPYKSNTAFVRPIRVFKSSLVLTCATGGACAVGDTGPGGGKVFYVAATPFTSSGSACDTGCKYLESPSAGWIVAATPAGQTNCAIAGTSTSDPGCNWSGNTSSATGATRTAIGAGYANTLAIIAKNGTAGKAATVARAFRGGGKTDWYLPALDELKLMSSQTGGPASGYCWSSSEIDGGAAWSHNFGGPTQVEIRYKTKTHCVRPVRVF